MEIDKDEIEVVTLPTKRPEAWQHDKYLKVYQCWQDIWLKEFGKLLETKDFTVYSELVALFYRGECIGFCFVDRKESTTGKMIYFRNISIQQKYRNEVSRFNWPKFFHQSVESKLKEKSVSVIFDHREGTQAMKLECPFRKAS